MRSYVYCERPQTEYEGQAGLSLGAAAWQSHSPRLSDHRSVMTGKPASQARVAAYRANFTATNAAYIADSRCFRRTDFVHAQMNYQQYTAEMLGHTYLSFAQALQGHGTSCEEFGVIEQRIQMYGDDTACTGMRRD